MHIQGFPLSDVQLRDLAIASHLRESALRQVPALGTLLYHVEILIRGIEFVLLARWLDIIHQTADRCFGYLSTVLARLVLPVFQMVEEALLLSEIVDVLAELGVDVLPHVMLAERVQTAHLGRFCD